MHVNKQSVVFSAIVIFAFVSLLTIYRGSVLSNNYIQLFYDEIQYYHWSLALDWGYYSKPPVIAWVIHITTTLFGHSAAAIKIGATILHGASAILIYLLAKALWGKSAAAASALVFTSTLLIGFYSLVITTDAPLIFCWTLSCWLFVLALKHGKWWYWLLAGFAVGVGMLSKYTMALLPLGFFIYLLSGNHTRVLLLGYKPWLAAITAGLIFSSNIIWNWQHNFVTFGHTSEISQLNRQLFHPEKLLEFWLGQILIFGPVWSYLLLKQWFSHRARQAMAYRGLLLAIFLPLFLVISLQAMLSRAFINWAAPCVVAASLSVGFYIANKRRIRPLLIGLLLNLALLSLFYHWPTIQQLSGMEPSRKNNPYQRVAGWQAMSEPLKAIFAEDDSLVLVSPSRKLLAYICYYSTPGRLPIARWNPDQYNIRDYYDMEFNLRNYKGKQQRFLLVDQVPIKPQIIQQFSFCKPLQPIIITVYDDLTRTLYNYDCQNFTGY